MMKGIEPYDSGQSILMGPAEQKEKKAGWLAEMATTAALLKTNSKYKISLRLWQTKASDLFHTFGLE